MIRRRFTQFGLLLVLSAITTTALAGKPPGKGGGNDGGGDDGGDPPQTILYEVEYISLSLLPGATGGPMWMRCNNHGQVVGRYVSDVDGDGTYEGIRGWLFDPARDSEHAIDLNMIVAGIPEGMEIYWATSINDSGDIGAALAPIGSSFGTTLTAALIDMNAETPTLHVVPDGDISNDTLIRDINDFGDLLGSYRRSDGTNGVYVYNFGNYDPVLAMMEPLDLGLDADWNNLFISNSGEIAGWLMDQSVAFRAIPGGAAETFDVGSPRGLNQFGEFCSGVSLKSGKGKKSYTTYPCIVAADVQAFQDAVTGSANDVNDSGDFIQDDHLYHRELGLIDVITVVDPDEQAVLQDSNLTLVRMTNRDSTSNLPILIGQAGGIPVRLVPISTP